MFLKLSEGTVLNFDENWRAYYQTLHDQRQGPLFHLATGESKLTIRHNVLNFKVRPLDSMTGGILVRLHVRCGRYYYGGILYKKVEMLLERHSDDIEVFDQEKAIPVQTKPLQPKQQPVLRSTRFNIVRR